MLRTMRQLPILFILFMSSLAWSQTTSESAKDCHCIQPSSSMIATVADQVIDMSGSAGFNTLDSETCKPQSEIARQSVFRMLLPGDETKSLRELFGKDDQETRQKLITMIRNDKASPPSTNDINIWQIEECIKKQVHDCSISMNYRTSTIVLTGDGSIAASAFHNLKLLLTTYLSEAQRAGKSAAETARTLEQIKLPAFLYNHDGKVVAQPNDVSIHLTGISGAQIEEAWKDPSTKRMATFLDTATLSLSRSIGRGAKLATHAPVSGDTLKIFGYPGETHAWQSVGGSDSNGRSMYCTIGPAISLETAGHRFKWSVGNLPPQLQKSYREGSVFTAAPSFGGMSGGAVFNERGELVATHSSGSDTPSNSTTANALIPRLSTVK